MGTKFFLDLASKWLSRKVIVAGAGGYGIYAITMAAMAATAPVSLPIVLAGIGGLTVLGATYVVGQSMVDAKTGKNPDGEDPEKTNVNPSVPAQ